MVDNDGVRRMALSLPETRESEGAFELNGKGFAWYLREHVAGKRVRVMNPDVLAVRVADLADKEALMTSNPNTFYSTPHYNGFPAILVRLAAIEPADLTELLADGYRALIESRKKRR